MARGGPRPADGDAVTPLSARAHVFVTDLDAPVLSGDDHHHLGRVLRLPPGSAVTAGDGAGGWRACRFTEAAALAIAGPISHDPRPAPPITVAFALVKGERPELAVQKLTELGVDRIAPFVAERSIVRWEPARAERQVERWRIIAHQAAMQSRRTWLAEVTPVGTFRSAAALPGAVLADLTGSAPSLDHPIVLVGPEGGWSPAERASGLPTVRFGAHVLRAETAAMAAGAILAAMRANLLADAPPSRHTVR
jgi:16S rRNA (uracil1498-N3)-methyltransferase